MSASFGWTAHRHGATPPSSSQEDLRPELADVGHLVRRGVRTVVGAARVGERDARGFLPTGSGEQFVVDGD